MNIWSIAITSLATILAILSAVLAIADRFTKPLNKLSDNIIELSTNFNAQNKNIEKMNTDNEIAHNAIWSKVNEQCAMLTDHDKTLAIMKDERDNKQ